MPMRLRRSPATPSPPVHYRSGTPHGAPARPPPWRDHVLDGHDQAPAHLTAAASASAGVHRRAGTQRVCTCTVACVTLLRRSANQRRSECGRAPLRGHQALLRQRHSGLPASPLAVQRPRLRVERSLGRHTAVGQHRRAGSSAVRTCAVDLPTAWPGRAAAAARTLLRQRHPVPRNPALAQARARVQQRVTTHRCERRTARTTPRPEAWWTWPFAFGRPTPQRVQACTAAPTRPSADPHRRSGRFRTTPDPPSA